MTYTIIMEPTRDGRWNALVPDLAGLLLDGETKSDLLVDAPGAILDYLDAMRDAGNAIPRAATEAAQVTVSLPGRVRRRGLSS
ncbi:MAG TPA: type II toxin-antitoxin system HicB family antitoxin [Candidatus Elarobacter sp.]|nr:type II toxin-antitoxin system HicB family antitoxin [Candidatus Elarobacter sp.]